MLPTTSYPLSKILIPSLGEERLFRPWLVKEEKILLMADQSKNPVEVMLATKQVIEACYSDKKKINFEKLTSFDVDYLFLKLRAMSVNNIMKVKFRDTEDGETRDFEIDINEIDLKVPEEKHDIVEVGNVKVKLRYPSMEAFSQVSADLTPEVLLNHITASCIDKIYDEETVYEDYTQEQLIEWLEQLPVSALDSIKKFFDNMPRVEWKIVYKNNKGNERSIVLSSLFDFFTWRSAL